MFKYFLKDISRKKWLYLFYIAIYSTVMIGTVVVMVLIMRNYCNQSSQNPAWNIYSINEDKKIENKEIQNKEIQNETYKQLKHDITKRFNDNIKGISESGQVKYDNRNYTCSYFEYSDISMFYSSDNKPGDGEAILSGELYGFNKQNISLEDVSGTKKGQLKIIDIADIILSGDLMGGVDMVLSLKDFDYYCNDVSQLNIEFYNHLDTIQLIKLKKICKQYGVSLSYQSIWKWKKIIAKKNYLIMFFITLMYAVMSVLFIKSYIISSQRRNFNIYFICGANPEKLKKIYFYIFTVAEISAWLIGSIIIAVINCVVNMPMDIFLQLIICIVYGMIVWLISFPWIRYSIDRVTLRKGK